MLCGSEPVEAISGVISSVGSVGPGLGDVASLDNYSAQPVMSKLIFSFDMFLGRMEIFPILIVLSLMFKRSR
jgi:trk system potassium uptake protein TrkH